jgi:hypothetical protein
VTHLQYKITINSGLDHNEEPQISFSMDEDTHTFLETMSTDNNITVGELVASFLMGAKFTTASYVN